MDQAPDDPYLDPFVAAASEVEAAGAGDDIAWALRLGRAAGGSVLDLGCGAGRLTLPLAEAGYAVVALDHSAAMLDRLRARLDRLPAATQSRVQVVQADLRAPDGALAGSSAALALLGFNTFAALLAVSEQQACLQAVRQALRPGGTLAVATAAVSARLLLLPEGFTREMYRLSAPAFGAGVVLVRRDVHRWTDETRQLRRLAHVYDVLEPDGGRRQHHVEYAARYSHRWELEHLLACHGFPDVQVAGGYAGEPFSVEGGLLVATAR